MCTCSVPAARSENLTLIGIGENSVFRSHIPDDAAMAQVALCYYKESIMSCLCAHCAAAYGWTSAAADVLMTRLDSEPTADAFELTGAAAD